MDSVTKFISFLFSKGYQLIENNEKFMFTTYEKSGFFVRIAEDTNAKFIILSRSNEHSWKGRYDMGLVRFLILKAHYEKDSTFKFEESSQFFIDHYEEILEVFKPANFTKSEDAFAVLKKERAKALFGY
ncbi:MAG: hypothetical protein ABI594_04390 [Ginsengibacter sp.]